MTEEREVTVEGNRYCVVISDEQEALLAAKAAGRAFVGVWKDGGGGLWGADYAVDSPEAADDRLLERVVRRRLGLPWMIAESERLCIREFTAADAERVPRETSVDAADAAWVPRETSADAADAVFYTPEKLKAYIQNQYGFYEYGIWAVVRKSDGRIVGKAGISDCDIRRRTRDEAAAPDLQFELGYHIFRPYRRQGYAEEACRLILDYVWQEYGCPVYAAAAAENTASVRLLNKLGFCFCPEGPGAGGQKIKRAVYYGPKA